MPIDRFYLDDPLEPSTQTELTGQELHHLSHVTRARAGGEIELINGKGSLAIAEILEIKKNAALLNIRSRLSEEPVPFCTVIAQAIPRQNRLDTIVEKSTELGMDELWLFPGKLSEKKELKENQLLRLRKIAISAMKQSGRLYLPAIKLIPPIRQWSPQSLPLYFGDIDADAEPFLKVWEVSPDEKGLIFVIGPESGLHEDEIRQLKELQAIGVKLHQHILRTDTAPLTALSLISHAKL